jgi:hypothetical protein
LPCILRLIGQRVHYQFPTDYLACQKLQSHTTLLNVKLNQLNDDIEVNNHEMGDRTHKLDYLPFH